MTDAEIRERLRAIDKSEVVDVDSWEAEFIMNVLYENAGMSDCSWPLSGKQRAKAIEIIERYEVQRQGEQETIVKLPPGKEKYFRRDQ